MSHVSLFGLDKTIPPAAFLRAGLVVFLSALSTVTFAQPGGGKRGPAPRPEFIPEGYNDQQNMMEQLGIKTLRPGKSGSNQTGDGFDEATSAKWLNSVPDVLTLKDGTKVTTPAQWAKRRAEILEDFEREYYGRIPANVPKVTWEVTATTEGTSGDIPTITKTLVGHVDNSAFPQITVNIQASFTVPANTKEPVPILVEFGGGGGGGGFGGKGGARAGNGPPPWPQQAIAHGWGYGYLNPGSIQADGGGNALRQGIIGLTNKGEPRKPEDWGALRAWGWGVGQLIDYFTANPDSKVDAKKVGIEGVSRYGKAALVAAAFEPRVAVPFVASSGAGGAKLLKRDFGESLENLTGGEYYWFAGNLLKYGASEATFGSKNAGDLPVDAHELIALVAPRPCLISNGIEPGDPKWIDAHGSFMSTVLAGPVYRLLGKKDLGITENYQTAQMPAVDQLVGGDLAWRQHSGGHTSVPNFPTFFEWVKDYVPAPAIPAAAAAPSAAAPSAAAPAASAPAAVEAPAPAPAQLTPATSSSSSTFKSSGSRRDANSRLAHEQLLAKAKQGRIDVYVIGDSIARRWGASDYPQFLINWKENFFGWNVADFGWGADTVENILWRLENGELDGVNPKIIVVGGGTNNVGGPPGDDARAHRIAEGLTKVVETCQQKAPGAAIVLMGIFPRNDNPTANATINKVNAELARLADGRKIRFLNINDKLADADGSLLEGMAVRDHLHLDVKGYQVWADGLKPIFTEILGPPAKEDQAPRPTGDPSAKK